MIEDEEPLFPLAYFFFDMIEDIALAKFAFSRLASSSFNNDS